MPALLPYADQENYAALVEAQENEEGFVNGIWFSILSQCFEAQIGRLEYSVNPEVAHVGVGNSDLLVTRNDFQQATPTITWQIMLEGKAGDSTDLFTDALDQLLKYVVTIEPNHFCYLIAARGGHCMFWKYQVGNDPMLDGEYKPMSVNVGGQVVWAHPNFPLSEEYSIVNDQNQISVLLDYIKNHPGGHR
ncbi:hypothetical protein H0H92_012371 [Tricholoma furcatifolium]|nr:hypothetical protein H0H92_012371 [Tricholoma furcatifolium]